jgi:hypothetical protein
MRVFPVKYMVELIKISNCTENKILFVSMAVCVLILITYYLKHVRHMSSESNDHVSRRVRPLKHEH